MKNYWIIPGLLLFIVLICGCTGTNQDEDFKGLVKNVADDFQGQKEVIMKPYQGLTPTELRQYKSAASSAISAAGAMKLSDKPAKARGIFIQAMNETINAVDSLEQSGKLTGTENKVSTESVSNYFITTQTKIDDTCSLLGIEREKTY